MKYIYEINPGGGQTPANGEIEAHDEEHAKRLLTMQYELPVGTNSILLSNLTALSDNQAHVRSESLRYLLQAMVEHHSWLEDAESGVRADLTGLNLSGVNLSGQNLQMARIAGVDLQGCDLTGANLQRADMSGCDLRDVLFNDANLQEADLSDADLRGANFTNAKLEGIDVWRANLRGTTIDPMSLHAALGCMQE